MRFYSWILVVFFLIGCTFSIPILAQQNPLVGEDKKTIKLFFEKTYLQTDRVYYGSGEDIWFSSFLVNGKSTSLTGTSNTLYVELINPKSVIIDHKIIRLEKGLGNGDFKLRDTLSSGWYQIRAYTNWMRNFGDDFVFQKKIYVTNSLKPEVKQPENLTKSKKTITFFPEGGNLVEGVMAIVAFKTNDEFGYGLAATANVISSKGDTVTTFKSTDLGMGIFAFTPLENEKYKVVGAYGAEKFAAELPIALKEGLALHLTADSATLKLAINTNEVSFAKLQDKPVSIVIKHSGDNVYTGTINLTKPNLSINISTKDLSAGLVVLTVIDHLGRPNCERLVYIQSTTKINFSIRPNQAIYNPKEKVTLTIKATDVAGAAVKTSLSLAVVDGLITNDPMNIVSYLTLQSELKGEIKNAEQYFDPQNPARFKQLDVLLLTQGWREYVWRKLAESSALISFMPEPGLTIKGSVKEKLGNKPLPNMNITLFGSNFIGNKIYLAKTDANGNYFLDGLNWSGNQAIRLSSQDAKAKKGGWLQIDTLLKPLAIPIKKTIPLAIPSNVNLEIDKRMAYNRTYNIGGSILLDEVRIVKGLNQNVQLFDQTLTTFGFKDQVFNITAADHSFKGLEHFLLTKVEGAFPLDSVGSEGVAFLSKGKKVEPRIIINNREEILGRLDYYSLTMDQINQIVVKHLLGNKQSEGQTPENVDAYVIYLDLKEDALRGPNLNFLNINLNGYYTARTFYSPNYTTATTNYKDLRTTLYWSPLLKTNENGELSVSYFNGNNTGDMVIKANGITSTGVAVSAKSTYKIQ